MFPACHDITENTLDACCAVLENLLAPGNKVLIVSKPQIKCIQTICNRFSNYKSQILFRFTIGSAHNKVLKFWEPNASTYFERIASLVLAYKLGFETSVSSEPMLDDYIYKVVKDTLPYITNAIWIGKANDLINCLILNGHKDNIEIMNKASILVKQQADDKFIKYIYNLYKDNPKVKWKDSIKQVVGLKRPTEKGLDI